MSVRLHAAHLALTAGHERVQIVHVDKIGRQLRVHSKFPIVTTWPDGEEWDFGNDAEFIRRLPHVARHCGLTA
ncbi:hypothetical protein [Acrocarpospora catenulata]|uniref:hypothetical protein n=1 Tax=Acrocarpospora catenulata TaxID=2836182 RepID=UPI001BDAD94F|nr:hypothetical protein [Acrocarpospora catenulata]